MDSSPAAHTAPDDAAGGLSRRLLDLAAELRTEGMAVGTSEMLDAFNALAAVSWVERGPVREALATTLAKSRDDRELFDKVFERFFFEAPERTALARGRRDAPMQVRGEPDLNALGERVRAAIRSGSEGEQLDAARLAVAAVAQSRPGGPLGVDVQRIRRALGLSRGERPGEEVPRERLAAFELLLRRELQRARLARGGELAPSRPLRELDRGLPAAPLRDLAAVQRVVAQLRRRLATEGREQRGRRRSRVVDVRRTMRASLETGGVPLRLAHRPRRPRRPKLYVLCDVSTSVTSATVFFLSVLHALHDAFRDLRSFVFIERVSEVSDVFARERSFAAVSAAVAADAGVADVSGYTDYGRVWHEFLALVGDDLDPRSSLLVLGDARTNGRDPEPEAFAAIAARAGRTFWLNPEPRLYWDYGDSVMRRYGPACDGVFECWTAGQLEDVVRALVTGHDGRTR